MGCHPANNNTFNNFEFHNANYYLYFFSLEKLTGKYAQTPDTLITTHPLTIFEICIHMFNVVRMFVLYSKLIRFYTYVST